MLSPVTAIWLLMALCVCLEGAQFTVEEPHSQAVPTGGNVSLSCSSPSATLYIWWVGTPPDRGVITAPRVTTDRSQLNISTFHAADHVGLYSCMVGLPGANAIFTCPANISHARIATHFVQSPSSMDASIGATVVLRCEPPFSNPAPLIQWKKDGTVLPTDSRVTILPTGNLYILNVTQADSGDYQCMATNLVSGARRRSEIATLTITDPVTNSAPPIITVLPTDTEVIVGETITLDCAATGHPTPSIFWERVFSRTFPRSDHVLPNGALSIGPVTMADAGRYRCMAENSEGMVVADAIITVKVPPQVTISPLPISLTVGGSVNLTCIVNTTDPVTLMWSSFTSVLLNKTVTPSSPSLTLEVSLSSSSDGKIYQCMALNHLGCSHAEVQLVVSQPASQQPTTGSSFTFPPFTIPPVTTPLTTSPPVSIQVSPTNVTILPGTTTNIQCVAAGSPLPTITWLVNGTTLTSRHEQTFGNTVRVATLNVSLGGNYTCIAWSGGNFTTAVVRVKVAPSTPVLSPSPTPEVTTPPVTTPPVTTPPTTSLPVSIQVSPTNVTILPGTTANIQCVATGSPLPTITWLVNDTTLTSWREQTLGNTVRVATLNVSLGGNYTCIAWSGSSFTTAVIRVKVAPSTPVLSPSPTPTPTPELTTPPEVSTQPPTDSPLLQVKADIEQVQVLERQPLSLVCTVIAGTAVNISWLFGGSPAPGRHTVREVEGQLSGKLELDAVTAEHDGQFVCVAVGSQREQSSATISVTVRITGIPPRFWQEPQDIVVFGRDAAGGRASLTLNCMTSGVPSPTIAWYRAGTRLSEDFVLTNGSLHIVEITEGRDATRGGVSYHCTANNTFGTIRSRAAIVSYAYFDGFKGPSMVVVNVTTDDDDDTVALECYVGDGNPSPQIRWLGNGVPLTEDRTNNRVRFLDSGHYLLIRELTTAQVNTTYQCEVINARLHETVTNPTTYNLVDNIGFNEIMIYKRLINRTILSGDTVEMSYIAGAGPGIRPFTIDDCRRTGDIQTRFFLRDDPGGVIEETIPRLGERIPLVADSVTFEVSCTLFSGTQSLLSEATITVQATPQIIIPSQQENDFKQLVGDSFIFNCTIAGIPTPTVTWYHDNVELHSGRRISITRVSPSMATLTISSLTVDDTGMYQCFASSVVGRTQYSWTLQVRTPAIPAMSASSSQGLMVDSIIGKPLLVSNSNGDQVILFAVVTADPCPSIQWMVNGTAVINSGSYTIGNPCSTSPAGTTSFNFTLTITATAVTAGTYNATLTNAAGTIEVPDVFVTPPVPVVITELRISSSPPCLLNGTSVDIQCVNFGFPRPKIVFFKGTKQITPSVAPFTNLEHLNVDSVRLITAQQADSGIYVCEARMGGRELIQSQPNTLVFCIQPTIVDLPAPVNHTEGDGFELVCTFTGVPTPKIRWEKDGNAFLCGKGRSIINSPGRSQLEINSLALSDAGVYTCSVSNVAGVATRSVRQEVRAMSPQSIEFGLERQLYSTVEGSGGVEVCVEVLQGNVTQRTLIGMGTSIGSVQVLPLDVLPFTSTLTFDLGDTWECVSIPVVDDDLLEDTESFLVSAFSLSSAATVVANRSSAKVLIADNEMVMVSFTASSYTVNESGSQVEVCVELSGQAELAQPVQMRVTSFDGTATAGQDFQAVLQLLTLPVGSRSGSTQCMVVDIMEDGNPELTEEFRLSLFIPDVAVAIPPGGDTTTVVIVDNEEFFITFTNNTPAVEGNQITVSFSGNMPLASATCRIPPRPNQNCTIGTAVFTGLPLNRQETYNVTISATSILGQSVSISREVRLDTSTDCWAHLINQGVVVSGKSATVEWQGTGPSADNRVQKFQCSLDGGTKHFCSSPLRFTQLAVGRHVLRITPDSDDCRRKISLNVSIQIE